MIYGTPFRHFYITRVGICLMLKGQSKELLQSQIEISSHNMESFTASLKSQGLNWDEYPCHGYLSLLEREPLPSMDHAPFPSYSHLLVSPVSYSLSLSNSKMSTSSLPVVERLLARLMPSLASVMARRSPRLHSMGSSKMAAEESKRKCQGLKVTSLVHWVCPIVVLPVMTMHS